MLTELRISNFRCYTDTTIHFNGTSILVGKNNAGKSTSIEALKIISTIVRKYKTARYIFPPEWVNERSYGISPNVENMNISDRGIFNMYGEAPAIIEAQFSNGCSIKAYIGEGLEIFAIIYDQDGIPVQNAKQAKSTELPRIEVLPQISAVLDNEKLLNQKTVDSNRATRLASRNFRNQLFYYNEAYPAFKELVESTWERLRVSPIEISYGDDGRYLSFFVRVNDFEAEIGWMGHGLQMWIQTMWFISQCSNDTIVVLDEPDVYMHADLQRRLVRMIMPMFSQVIIATHSLEIIEEVPSDCIIPINSSKKKVLPIGNEKSLQLLTKELDNSLNIDLARIFVANNFIIWDSDETSRKILSAFQSVLYPNALHSIITYPKAFVKGDNAWNDAKAIIKAFAANNVSLKMYAIFNNVNKTAEDINLLQADAELHHTTMHVWKRREIDNYAIQTEAIVKYIAQRTKSGEVDGSLIEEQVNDVISILFDEAIQRGHATSADQPLDVISGRTFFNILSKWTQLEYNCTVSARHVVGMLNPVQVPAEVKKVIAMLTEDEK
jgi:AAA15 family ATPase/GTPase